MNARGRPRRADGIASDPVRSVRIGNAEWEKGKRRATYEGQTPSGVLALLWKGFADGLIDLPKVQVIYTPTRPAAVVEEPEVNAAAS